VVRLGRPEAAVSATEALGVPFLGGILGYTVVLVLASSNEFHGVARCTKKEEEEEEEEDGRIVQ